MRSLSGVLFPRAKRIRRAVQAGGRDREDLIAGGGYADGVLELRRQRAVLGDRGPAVAQNLHLPASSVDHRLDGEDHSLVHNGPLVGLAVVQDRRGIVKDAAHTVAAKVSHHRKAVTLGIALDRVADGPDASTGTYDGDAAHHRLIGYVDEPSRLDRDALADKKHPAGVAVPAVDDRGHVDVEYVALDQSPLARKAAIVERRRNRIVVGDEVVA